MADLESAGEAVTEHALKLHADTLEHYRQNPVSTGGPAGDFIAGHPEPATVTTLISAAARAVAGIIGPNPTPERLERCLEHAAEQLIGQAQVYLLSLETETVIETAQSLTAVN